MGFTSPTAALMTEEDAERTLTIGNSHLTNLSSADVACSEFLLCSDCATSLRPENEARQERRRETCRPETEPTMDA